MPSWTRPAQFINGADAVGMPTLRKGSTTDLNGSSAMSKALTPSPPQNLLPVPVQQGAGSVSSKRRQKKNARIGGGFKVHWANLRKRIATGTAPSTSSMVGESTAAGSSITRPPTMATDDEKEEVDEVVVDRTWSEEIKSSVVHSEAGVVPSPEKSNSHQPVDNSMDHDSLEHYGGFWALSSPLVFIRWRLWPMVMEFFTSRFFDEKSEEHYRKENWFMRKVCVYFIWWQSSLIDPLACCVMVFYIPHHQLGSGMCIRLTPPRSF